MKRLIAWSLVMLYIVPYVACNALYLTIVLPFQIFWITFEWARKVASGEPTTYHEVWQDTWDNSLTEYIVDNLRHPLR